MRIIIEGEPKPYLPDDTVKGVELDGLPDALGLARCLGAYALEKVELPYSGLGMSQKSAAAFAEIGMPLAAEALTLQAQLLKQIEEGGVMDEPFSF